MITKIIPCLWFDECAEQAMNYYLSVFPNSEITHIERYPDESLNEHFVGKAGKVISGEFVLDGVKFRCLDGGPVFKMNEAISFTIDCKDQSEIDYYWEKLSYFTELEQCGWCKDQFGMTWQILPHNMGELLANGGNKAIQVMMQQQKIIISDIENAK
ncbi:VOC family protein [Lactovum miscens]|uniref:Putative 3-demethylubiquinone-9 3-methyltransferase (Glyoxalase superfamily) n=1 Tax=Lactovum miscens TaxID=190387 RepID=A0A841C3R0_9LACT|nr:VOC family protein [Lactovum miscens]MBB5887463.1 putative 3-demethylubiquinone-9 3-methyltransferase (glyoxalase superfamily) [Lactovum miscens]